MRWRLASVPGLSDWYQDRISCTRAVVRSGMFVLPCESVDPRRGAPEGEVARNLGNCGGSRQAQKPAPARTPAAMPGRGSQVAGCLGEGSRPTYATGGDTGKAAVDTVARPAGLP